MIDEDRGSEATKQVSKEVKDKVLKAFMKAYQAHINGEKEDEWRERLNEELGKQSSEIKAAEAKIIFKSIEDYSFAKGIAQTNNKDASQKEIDEMHQNLQNGVREEPEGPHSQADQYISFAEQDPNTFAKDSESIFTKLAPGYNFKEFLNGAHEYNKKHLIDPNESMIQRQVSRMKSAFYSAGEQISRVGNSISTTIKSLSQKSR
ncbi:MAG: hypothetical protein SFT93_05825 [Rickettsiaceae bacterium]|nr:hypothetical protein [Rickettsiaceae bacterium]